MYLNRLPQFFWDNPGEITYGEALNSTQLNASASVPGSFVYTPVSGTVLSAGVHNLQVDFTPNDTANYSTTSKNVTINVFKSAPIITWNKPANIIYETELNDTQLDASALIPGAFTYTPASGTMLSAGNQTLHVEVTPNDAANYSGTSKNVTINVEKSTPTITWSYPTDIIYETALNSTQLNASASVTGSFVYTPASGTVLSAGTKTLHANFTPTDIANYSNTSKDVTINVSEVTPTITWSNPADITCGTALNNTQLNALAQYLEPLHILRYLELY